VSHLAGSVAASRGAQAVEKVFGLLCARTSRQRLGLRWQSAAATPLFAYAARLETSAPTGHPKAASRISKNTNGVPSLSPGLAHLRLPWVWCPIWFTIPTGLHRRASVGTDGRNPFRVDRAFDSSPRLGPLRGTNPGLKAGTPLAFVSTGSRVRDPKHVGLRWLLAAPKQSEGGSAAPTPLSHAPGGWETRESLVRSKAPSPLRSAGALQSLAER
jgi:hypothetical protein